MSLFSILRGPFASGGSGGGASLTASPLVIDSSATGVVAQLASSLSGVLTFSRLSGANVTVAGNGAVSFTTALAAGATRALSARVQNASGDAIERTIVFTGLTVAASLSAATPSRSVVSLAAG